MSKKILTKIFMSKKILIYINKNFYIKENFKTKIEIYLFIIYFNMP